MSPADPPPAPQRVLVLVDLYVDPFGGTEGQIRTLLSHRPPGIQAEMWVLQGSRWLRENPFPVPTRDAGIRRLASPRGLLGVLALARAIRRHRFDLVQTFMNDASIVGPLAARLAGVPAVVARRDLGFWQTPRSLAILRRTDRLAARIVANSQAVAGHTAEAEHVPPGAIAVVPNGIARESPNRPPAPEGRAGLGIPAEAPVVALVANVRPLKRHDDLLDALVRLAPRWGDVHAMLLGDEFHGDEPIAQRVARRGLEHRVRLRAAAGGVRDLLRLADVGVLCSETEGFSNAILEYMAAGLPVVATRVGGAPEMVVEGETGYLIDVGDVAALADRLDRLLGDGDLRRRLGAAGRRRVEAAFTVERMTQGVGRVWRQALAPPVAARALTVEVVEDRPALAALATGWDALLGPGSLFVGPDWVLAWLDTLGQDRAPFVLVAREPEGTLAGVLPLVRGPGGTLGFAGAAHGADHLDVAALAGRADTVAEAMLARLATERFTRLDLAHLAEDGALRRHVHARRWALPYGERLATTCPFLAAAGGFESYLDDHLSKAARRNVRRYPRRFRALPGASVERVTAPAEAPAAVDRLFALHARRFAALGAPTALLAPGVQTFHRALATAMARRGRLQATFLRLGGRDVAGEYAFVHAGRMHAFQGGFDPAAPFESPGLVLQAIVLEDDVFGRGLAEYDFLDGGEEYKRRWATGRRRLFDVTVRPPTMTGRIAALVAGLPHLARDLLAARRQPGEDGEGRRGELSVSR